MVTVNQWNWRLVVCWGWTSTTNGESETPNDIVSVDRRSRRPTGPELRVDPHGISWFISQPSKPPGSSKTKKHPGVLCPSFTHWIKRKPTTNTQAGPSRSPGRSPGAGPWRRVTPVYGLSTKIGGRQAVRQPWTPRARHPIFFSAKKKDCSL